MMGIFPPLVAILTFVTSIHAAALLSSRQGEDVTPLTADQVAAYKPYTYYAAAAGCQPSTLLNWTCGNNCENNPTFIPTDAGGDGGLIQFWYVGFDPTLNTVVVSHEGTDPSHLEAIITDLDFIPGTLNSTLFPGVPSSIWVHEGFAAAHARAAPSVLSAVNRTLSDHPGASVTMTGGSLGGALALLDSVFLPLHLPNGTNFKTVAYCPPRVGNQAFADYIDAHVASQVDGMMGLSRLNYRQDPVPLIPCRDWGFQHPSGEVHVQESGDWDSCAGQENPSLFCSDGAVPTLADADITNHCGIFDSVTIAC